jgi:hypothetical protein
MAPAYLAKWVREGSLFPMDAATLYSFKCRTNSTCAPQSVQAFLDGLALPSVDMPPTSRVPHLE